MSTNIAGQIAGWVAAADYAQLPRRVVDEAKSQILSVIAAVHAGHFSEAGRMVSRTVREWAGGKEATLIPSGERTSHHYAIIGNAALSMALDYDDYLFGGHTGHSAVLVPLALAEKIGVSGKQFLLAQVVANEVGGRVGISVLGDPVESQMASFVHLAGAAVSAAKLLGLDGPQIEHALGIAFTQPNIGLPAAFFGSDARALVASTTAPLGVQAAEFAGNGFRCPSDVFDGERGFLRTFSRAPLPGAFTGFGRVWLTETLCYKIYPASAGVAAVVDCVLNLVRQHHIDGRKVRTVDVLAGPLTIGADAMSAPYLKGAETLPAALSGSVAYNVAAALIDREISPRQLTADRVKDPVLWKIAGRVRLGLDEEMARRVRERSPLRAALESGAAASFQLENADLTGFRMGYGARVRIELEDGRSFEATQESPYGGGTRSFDDRRKAVEDKFRRETRYTLKKERMEKAIDLVHHLEDANAAQIRELVRLCCSEKG